MRDYGAVEQLVRRLAWIAPLVLILVAGWVSTAVAQVSPQVQEELRRRGMTAREALQEAERYGVDASSPEALERPRPFRIVAMQIEEVAGQNPVPGVSHERELESVVPLIG